MYIKYKDIKDKTIDEIKAEVGENTLLMSGDEFNSGGKEIEGVPIAVTPDGEERRKDETYLALLNSLKPKATNLTI